MTKSPPPKASAAAFGTSAEGACPMGGPSQPGPALPRSVMKVTRERHQAGPKTIVVRRRITPRRDRDPGQIEGSRNEDE
jgi:hypothetical protein